MAETLEEKDELVEITHVGEVHPAPFGEDLNEVHFNTKDDRNFVMWARHIPAIQTGQRKIHSLKCQKADKIKTIYWKCTAYEPETTAKPASEPLEPTGPDAGMSWKEVGENLRTGWFEKTLGKIYTDQVRLLYLAHIFNATRIKIEKKVDEEP